MAVQNRIEEEGLPAVIARYVRSNPENKTGLLRTYLAMTEEWIALDIPRNDGYEMRDDDVLSFRKFCAGMHKIIRNPGRCHG